MRILQEITVRPPRNTRGLPGNTPGTAYDNNAPGSKRHVFLIG